jgi:hypothetical protein
MRISRMQRAAFLLVVTQIVTSVPAHSDDASAAPRVEFDQDVRPVLVKHCFACHGPSKQKGGLRFDRRSAVFKGGDSGPAIVPRRSAESLIVQLTSGEEEGRVMPPKGARLSAGQVATLRNWIDQGANWPDVAGEEKGERWWSLRPLNRPSVPALSPADARGSRNPIDAFVLARLRDKGLSPSPEAGRPTLIRRLTFDLVGLPPSQEELDAFIADPAPDAYETLVDRLLASPQYGERWARHWLDVVHYGETHGYDKDQPRPTAWPYRDYVIRSFNADKPYSQFALEQIAGDVLFPGSTEGITATGFIAAGPWDLIGHAEVTEDKIDGKIARHLDRDDMVSNTINTFLGLTVQCAQCHNHKFDPIRQDEYYSLQAVFAALDRANRPYYTDPAKARKAVELKAKHEELRSRQKRIEATLSIRTGGKLTELDRRIAAATAPAKPRPEFGYHSAIAARPEPSKWVQLDLGSSVPVQQVVLWGCHDDFGGIGAGFGFPVRFRVDASNDVTFAQDVMPLADRTRSDVPNPGITPLVIPAHDVKARYIRVSATRLAPRQNDFNFALAEIVVLDKDGRNKARGARVTALDSIEAPPRWGRMNIVDGYAPGQERSGELESLKAERASLLDSVADAGSAHELAEIAAERSRVEAEMAQVQPDGLVYAGMVYNGGGAAFRGTGRDGGKPRRIYVLRRGDVKSPGSEVVPGALDVLRELPGSLRLSETHNEGDRRATLARWLTDVRNALCWRVIVNRIWQYHFGRGIVGTANDFGRMGQLPTHPELLDWLAIEFRDGGQSLKALHRLIVTSATYRQVSLGNSAAEAVDAGNAYLWRMNRRKLEAEAIRDAALLAAGKLDSTMYGPSFQDFVVQHPEHSPHYEYQLQPLDDRRIFRRAVYRFLVRSKPQPFMAVLDCADPSMQVDKRNETLSPLQSLALYNNGFMLTVAGHLAERVKSAGDPAEQVSAALRLALGREPNVEERSDLAEYARAFGLANTCRVILNLNEFMFVD